MLHFYYRKNWLKEENVITQALALISTSIYNMYS